MLTAEADGGRVHDRKQLFEVAYEQGVEQHLVGVLQSAQEDIALEIGSELAHRLEATRGLLVEGGDHRRQETVQVEGVALFLGESGSLVEQRRVQEVVAAAGRLDIGAFQCREPLLRTHRAFSRTICRGERIHLLNGALPLTALRTHAGTSESGLRGTKVSE